MWLKFWWDAEADLEKLGWERGMGSTGTDHLLGPFPRKKWIYRLKWRVLVNFEWHFFKFWGQFSLASPTSSSGDSSLCTPWFTFTPMEMKSIYWLSVIGAQWFEFPSVFWGDVTMVKTCFDHLKRFWLTRRLWNNFKEDVQLNTAGCASKYTKKCSVETNKSKIFRFRCSFPFHRIDPDLSIALSSNHILLGPSQKSFSPLTLLRPQAD